MPRLAQSVPKYRRHKASSQAFVELNGRRHYLGPHGTKASKLEYDRLISEWLANGRRSAIAPEAITVVELCAAYWKFADTYYRKDGRPTCLHAIKRAIKAVRELYGRHPAAEFGPLALKAVRQRMIDAGKSRTYINEQIAIIRRMFKWGVAEQLVPADVYQALAAVDGLRKGRSGARETGPITPIDETTIAATIAHLPDVVADMVRFQRLTGCRPDEVCSLRPRDVEQTGEVWTYTPESHKTEHHGRARTIVIGPQAQGILLRDLARDAADYCFRPCGVFGDQHPDGNARRLRAYWRCGGVAPQEIPGTARESVSVCCTLDCNDTQTPVGHIQWYGGSAAREHAPGFLAIHNLPIDRGPFESRASMLFVLP